MAESGQDTIINGADENVDGMKCDKGEEICFFGGEISFDAPTEYDDKPDKVKEIRSAYSMTHFSIFVYILVSQGVAALFTALSAFTIAMNGGGVDSINADFLLVLNAVSQYLIAFPLFLLLAKNVKRNPPVVKESLSFGKFMLLFAVAEGVMMAGAFVSSLCSDLFDRLIGASAESAIDTLLGESSILLSFVCVCILAPIFEELIFRKMVLLCC